MSLQRIKITKDNYLFVAELIKLGATLSIEIKNYFQKIDNFVCSYPLEHQQKYPEYLELTVKDLSIHFENNRETYLLSGDSIQKDISGKIITHLSTPGIMYGMGYFPPQYFDKRVIEGFKGSEDQILYPTVYNNYMALYGLREFQEDADHVFYCDSKHRLDKDYLDMFKQASESAKKLIAKEKAAKTTSTKKSKKKKKQEPPKPVNLKAKSKRSHVVIYDNKQKEINPFKQGKVKEPKLGNVCVRLGKEPTAEIRRLPKPEATILVETNSDYSYVSKVEWKEWKRSLSLTEVQASSRNARRGNKVKGIPSHRLMQRAFVTKELPRREETIKFGKGTENEQDITIVRAAKTIVKSFKEFNISKSKLFHEMHLKSRGYVTTLAKYEYRLIGHNDSITSSKAETWINTDDKDKAKALLEGKIKTKQGDKIKEVIVDIKELIPMKKRADKFYPVDICTVTVTFPDNPELQTLTFSKKGSASATDKWKKELSEWLNKKYSNIHHFINSSYKHRATSARITKDTTTPAKKVEFDKVEVPVIAKPKWYRRKESVKKEDGSVETNITYSPLTSITIFKRKKVEKPEVTNKEKKWVCPMREKPKKLSQLDNRPKIGLKIK